MKNSLLSLLLLFLVSCGSSNIILSPDLCASKGSWQQDYSNVEDQELVKKEGSGFNINKRIWTPLGVLGTKTIYLKDILEYGDIACRDIYSIDYTVKGDWIDAIRSFIPFMGSKTVGVSGTFDPDTRTREYKEKKRKSKIIIYDSN